MGLLYNAFSNITFTDILTGLLYLTCIYVIHFYYKYFTRVNPLPGPTPIPLIGGLANFTEDIDDWFWRLSKKYGDHGVFELNFAGNRRIFITSAEHVDTLLAAGSSAHFMRTANDGILDLFDLDKKGVGLNHDYEIQSSYLFADYYAIEFN